MIVESILAAVAAQPHIRTRDLISRFTHVGRGEIYKCLRETATRWIDRDVCGPSRYRAVKQVKPVVPGPQSAGSGFIAAPSRERLMAGR
jgi:hypothetical protein